MGQMFYGCGEHVLMGIIAYNCKKMIRDKYIKKFRKFEVYIGIA